MTINFESLNSITSVIKKYDRSHLMIVTKNQSIEDIKMLIINNFKLFGENRVQEARSKYEDLKDRESLSLHLIGPLQTNKVKLALKIFDSIQTIDRYTLVDEVGKILNRETSRTKEFYIQVNIGYEDQKSGVLIKDIPDLYQYSLNKGLNIVGLMCIPPNLDNPSRYFEQMVDIKDKINKSLKLSMGMSNDYKYALNSKSNMIRIGSLIFK